MMASCPELREIWHFGREPIMPGSRGQGMTEVFSESPPPSAVIAGLDPAIHPLRKNSFEE
jgi:hypothetical protein